MVTEISDILHFQKISLTLFYVSNADDKINLGLYLSSKLVSSHQQFGDHNLEFLSRFKILSVYYQRHQITRFFRWLVQQRKQTKAVRHTLQCLKTNFMPTQHANDGDEVHICYEHPRPRIYFTLVTPNVSWFHVASLI